MPTEVIRQTIETRHEVSRWQATKIGARQFAGSVRDALVMVGLYVTIMMGGPVLEALVSPAATDIDAYAARVPAEYRSDDKVVGGDAIAFKIAFTKRKLCPSGGRSWFITNDDGVTYRLPPQMMDKLNVMSNRPLGRNVGDVQVVAVPPQAVKLTGEQLYDCGWPWWSRITLGPFDVQTLRDMALK